MSQIEYSDRITAALQKCGLSGSGANWVEQSCNPVGNYPPTGIPSSGSLPSTKPKFFTEFDVQGTVSEITDAYDACLVIAGGSNTTALVATGPPGTNFDLGIGITSSYARSITAPRMCTEYEFGAQTSTGPATTDTSACEPPRDYHAFRWASKFVTVYSTAAAVNNGGALFAATFPGAPANIGKAINHGNLRTEYAYYGTLYEQTFTQFAPRSYTAPAREGIYLPIPINPGPYVRREFYDGQALALMGGQVAGVLDEACVIDSFMTLVSAETGKQVAWIEDVQNAKTNPNGPFGSSDIGFDSSGLTIIVLRGVSGVFRVRIGGTMEAVPTTASAEIPYITQANPFDPEALKCYELIRSQMPYAFPAKYNFLGFLSGLLPKIISGISAVGRFLAPAARTAATTVVADLAQRATHHIAGTPPEHSKPRKVTEVEMVEAPTKPKEKVLIVQRRKLR